MPWYQDRGLWVSIARCDDVSATVRLAGEIDITTVAAARRALTPLLPAARRIIVDLSQVTFCDLAGVRFFTTASELAGKAGAELAVRYPPRAVSRMLGLTGTLQLLCPDTPGASGQVPAPDAAVVSACELAVAEAIGVSGADAGNAQLVERTTGTLRIVAQQGFRRPFLDFFEIVHGPESACGTALAGGTPVWVPEVARSPIFTGTPALGVMLDADARAVASVPVRTGGGDVIAMISVHCRQPVTWTVRQRQQLAAVAAATGRLLSPSGISTGHDSG